MSAAPASAPSEVTALFRRHFGALPVHVVRAPGRLELLGNHTDYNEGLVLALAVDRSIGMAVAPRSDGIIRLVSSAYPEPETFAAREPRKNPAAPWADYVKGILRQLLDRGAALAGFDAMIHGTLPAGAGMSSSAALEVATALVVRRMYPYALTATGLAAAPRRDAGGQLAELTVTDRLQLAKLCQTAESEFVGVRCGLLDPISILFGKAHHALEIDCQSLKVEPVPLIGEVAIVVVNSGVQHALIGGEYNALREHCEAAARALGVRSLRSVDARLLAANRARLSERQHACAYHVVGEIQRVVHGAAALRSGDFSQFGQFMLQSHESSRDFFHNSCAELDLLVAIARKHPACYGARLSGGGFGGATIQLVARSQAELFMGAVAREYRERTGHIVETMRCEIAGGAQ